MTDSQVSGGQSRPETVRRCLDWICASFFLLLVIALLAWHDQTRGFDMQSRFGNDLDDPDALSGFRASTGSWLMFWTWKAQHCVELFILLDLAQLHLRT